MENLDLSEFKQIWNLDPKYEIPYFFENQLNLTNPNEQKINQSINYLKRIQEINGVFQIDKLLNVLIQNKNETIQDLYYSYADDVIDSYLAILFSLYGGFIPINKAKFDFSFKINEKVLLFLFHGYLKELVQEKNTDSKGLKKFFELENNEKSIIQKIINEMGNWLENLETIQNIQKYVYTDEKLKETYLVEYSLKVKERIQKLDADSCFIIPNGLPYEFMDAGVAIISKNNETNRLNWSQIMCNSEYHEFTSTQYEVKNSCVLELEDIDSNKCNTNLIAFMTKLKIQANIDSNNSHGNLSFLYELLISKLDGKVRNNHKNKEGYLFKPYVKHYNGQYWYAIINSFHYLLNLSLNDEKISNMLFKKNIFYFKFVLLKKIAKKTFENYESLKASHQEACLYLVQEICDELSLELLSFDSIFGKLDDCIIEEFTHTIETIKNKFKCFQDEQKKKEKNLNRVLIEQPIKPREIVLEVPCELQPNKIETSIKERRILFPDYSDKSSPFEMLNIFHNSFLLELKKTYSITNVLRLADGIENLIIDTLLSKKRIQDDISNWCKNCQDDHNSIAQHLVNLCSLYYDCQFRLAFFKKDEVYDPIQYGKTIILFYAVYAMIDVIVRQNNIFREIFSVYRLSTELKNIEKALTNSHFSFHNISQNMVVNEAKWTRINKLLQIYFLREPKSKKKIIFKYHAITWHNRYLQPLSIDIEGKNYDENISLSLKIVETVENVEKKKKGSKKEFKKKDKNDCYEYAKLFYSDEFLPILIREFRNISILAQMSLCGLNLNLNNIPDPSDSEKFQICKEYDRIINMEKSVYIGSSYYSICFEIMQQMTFCTVDIQIENFHRVFVPYDSLIFSGYRTKDKDDKFQSLICKSLLEISSGLVSTPENKIISSQYKQPKHMTKYEYFTIGFIKSNSKLKLKRLLINLETNLLSFENENHCYLIKQTIFETHMTLREYFKNEKFAQNFIKVLQSRLKNLQKKTMQCLAMGNIVEILVQLIDYCQDNEKLLIFESLQFSRETFHNWLRGIEANNKNDNIERMAIIHAYLILSYFASNKLTDEDVLNIVISRFSIENYISQNQIRIQKTLFLQVLSVMHRNEKQIDITLAKNSHIFNRLHKKPNQCSWLFDSSNWKLNLNTNHYESVSENASFNFVSGIYFQKDQTPKYDQIFNHKNYEECYGKRILQLYPLVGNSNEFGTSYKSEYKTEFKKTLVNVRFRLFNSILIIEENMNCDRLEDEYERFIPRQEYKILPKQLLEKNTLWYSITKKELYIKDQHRARLYVYYFNTKQLVNFYNQTQIIPFNELRPLNNNFLCNLLQNFEDPQYIIGFKNADSLKIELPRLNLSFTIKENLIKSNDFDGYFLSEIQILETLSNIPQYLVLEKSHVSNKKYIEKLIIIANRDINDRELFYSPQISFKLPIVNKPPYFLYRFDPILGSLKAETTAGKLYLSLLYYKTASLNRDSYTGLNGYENAMSILDSCWQNSSYDEVELSIVNKILLFKDEQFSNENEVEIFIDFDQKFVKFSDCHRNSSCVWLKTLYLMTASLNMHFLFMREEEIKYLTECFKHLNHYYRFYFPTYFAIYLKAKERIGIRCHLTLDEEKLLIEASYMYWNYTYNEHSKLFSKDNQSNYHFKCLYENYSNSLKDENNTIKLVKPSTINFLITQMKLFSIKNIQSDKYEDGIKKMLYIHSIIEFKDLQISNDEDWITYLFNFDNILEFYREAKRQKNEKEKQLFEIKLHTIALRFSLDHKIFEINNLHTSFRPSELHISIDLCILFLKMFYIIASYQDSSIFPEPPNFIFDEDGKYNCQHYDLNPIFAAIEARKRIDEVKHSKILSIVNFFLEIGKICDIVKLRNIGKNINIPLEDQFTNYEYVSSKNTTKLLKSKFFSKPEGKIELNVELVDYEKDINKIQNFLKNILEKKIETPDNKCTFPFDWIDTDGGNNCQEIKKTLNDGYGKIFISEMRKSWEKYLKSNENKYHLKENCFTELKNYLDESYEILENLSNKLHKIIELYLNSLPNSAEQNVFKLLRYLGKFKIPSKTEILKLFLGKELIADSSGDSNELDIENKKAKIEEEIKKIEDSINTVKDQIEDCKTQNGEDSDEFQELEDNKNLFELKKKEKENELATIMKKITRKKNKDIMDKKASILFEKRRKAINDFNPFLNIDQIKELLKHLDGYFQVQLLFNKLKRIIIKIDDYEKIQDEKEKDLVVQDIGHLLDEQQFAAVKKEPTWQMFELENNLFIRKQQAELANKMHSDVNESNNTLYQLNMGEGKSSVVLIILSELLTSDKKLVRITVIEPLLATMKALLSERFGQLLQKRIYMMPFSRNVDVSITNLEKIKAELVFCKENEHILLMTPEHRLSFQLKWEEILLDYLVVKRADNKFDWEIFHHYNPYSNYCTHHRHPIDQASYDAIIEGLKAYLIKLNFIDKNNIIKNYPDNWPSFQSKISQESLNISHNIITNAYNELRSKSVALKTDIETKLNLLLEIDKIVSVDVLDESDEILRYGVELNYTLGEKNLLDGGKMRWEVAETIFEIIYFDSEIQKSINDAAKKGLTVYESRQMDNGVPQIQIIDQNYYNERLKKLILNAVLIKAKEKGRFHKDGFKFDQKFYVDGQAFEIKDFIFESIEDKNDEALYEEIKKTYNDDDLHLHFILILKGWLSHQVLFHVLSKRYRVEYGLDFDENSTNPVKLAVPFKSKDLPSPRTEFSHPDIKIGFTYISYFYNGLNEEQIKEVLRKLNDSSKSNANEILKSWREFQINKKENDESKWAYSFDTLDISDQRHISTFTSIFKLNFKAICFYLNYFVFPEGTKQYEYKITGNALTLVKNAGTVGFSGTDDKKVTIPMSVMSKSYDEISNGKMLHILSRPINQKYYTISANEKKSVEQNTQYRILNEICEFSKSPENKNTSILIDSGALLTGITNLKVAEYLLNHLGDKFQGCVFFDDSTAQIKVLLRNYNSSIPYVNCHLSKEQLFTYLDDQHTRGTDLKFPLTANGIVTIGKDMNKDKLMQATMRLRQLNSKQSICIFGTRETSLTIANLHKIDNIDKLLTSHVINWVTYNTIIKIKKDLFHVVLQNVRALFKRRALNYQQNCKVPIQVLIENCRDLIIVSLETLYLRSTRKRDPRRHLHTIVEIMKGTFWDIFEANLKEYQNSLIIPNENINVKNKIKADQLEDDKLIENIEKHVMDKYGKDDEIDAPKVIKTTNNGSVEFSKAPLDGNQEVQMEIEISQVNEIPLPSKVNPHEEIPWDFDLIYSPQFYNKNDFIKPLKECFADVKTLIQRIEEVTWSPFVFVTNNFIKTVNDRNQFFEYMRPVEFILMCKSNDGPVAILLSGFEAEKITECLENRCDPNLTLLHLKASNSEIINVSTSIPSKSTLNKAEKDLLTVIKLFNGECNYAEDEINYLKKLFCRLDEKFFVDKSDVTEQQSEYLYRALISSGYIGKNGFFTLKMCNLYSKQKAQFDNKQEDNEILFTEFSKLLKNENINIIYDSDWMERRWLRLNQAVKGGFCDYNHNKQNKGLITYKLSTIIKKIIEIRGRIKEYECSKLKTSIFEE